MRIKTGFNNAKSYKKNISRRSVPAEKHGILREISF